MKNTELRTLKLVRAFTKRGMTHLSDTSTIMERSENESEANLSNLGEHVENDTQCDKYSILADAGEYLG